MGNVWRAFKQKELPDNYFRVEVILLRSLGIELMKDETWAFSIISKIFLFLLVFVFTFSEMYEIYAQWGNVDLIVATSTYLITHITGGIKTTLLYKNRKRIGMMLKKLQERPFKPDINRGGNVEEKLIRNVIRKTEIQLLVYFLVVAGTIFSGGINVLVKRFTAEKDDWKFPYVPTMSFADMLRSPFYELGCLYQFLSVILYAIIIATTYILLSAMMAHISIQMEILGNSLRKLYPRAKFLQEIRNSEDGDIDFYLKVAMKDSLDHHLQILDLAKEMEILCSRMILAIVLASIVLLCFILYYASLCPILSILFFQNVCYYFIIVCQVGMYSYWGNELTLKAADVAEAAMASNWVDAPRSVSKAVIMIVGAAQRPLYITAGGFVPMGMILFLNIIKGSASYFTVLKQTQE